MKRTAKPYRLLLLLGIVALIALGCSRPVSQSLRAGSDYERTLAEEQALSEALIARQATERATVMPVTTDSDRALARFLKARKYRHDFTHLAESERLLKEAVAIDPAFALAYVYLSLHYSTQGDQDARRAALTRAWELRDRVSPGEQLFITAMYHGGPSALASWERLVAMYPGDAYAHLILGYVYKNEYSRYHDALASFQRALALDGTLGNAYNMLGYTYIALDDYVRAEEAFRTYLDLFPDSGNPYDSMGDLCLKMGRYEEAAGYFDQAYALEPAMTWSRDKAAEARDLMRRETQR